MTLKRPTLNLKRAKPEPAPLSKTQARKAGLNAVCDVLRNFEVWRKCWPLKIGFYLDVLALPELSGFDPKVVSAAIGRHCRTGRYRENLENMMWRYDLSGNRIERIGDTASSG